MLSATIVAMGNSGTALRQLFIQQQKRASSETWNSSDARSQVQRFDESRDLTWYLVGPLVTVVGPTCTVVSVPSLPVVVMLRAGLTVCERPSAADVHAHHVTGIGRKGVSNRAPQDVLSVSTSCVTICMQPEAPLHSNHHGRLHHITTHRTLQHHLPDCDVVGASAAAAAAACACCSARLCSAAICLLLAAVAPLSMAAI